MTDRQPTEHEWGLIAKRMGWGFCPEHDCDTCELEDHAVIQERYTGSGNHLVGVATESGTFDPLHDERDLARLVEAMLEAGYTVERLATPMSDAIAACMSEGHYHPYRSRVTREKEFYSEEYAYTDIKATSWAIVEALVAEEKRKDCEVCSE